MTGPASVFRAPRPIVRRDAGLWCYESALQRAGFGAVAGADEAGRGACAGPLVVAACVLPPGRRGYIDGLDDSKALRPAVREELYARIVRRASAWSVKIIPAAEIDAWGLHVANLAGMRRALGELDPRPDYALTDGFAVPGLPMPATAVWKGDAVAACVAAASILAKVTRDRIMAQLHERFPQYDFARHKGYITAEHSAALREHGPCPEHRRRYVNVRRAMGVPPGSTDSMMSEAGGEASSVEELAAALDEQSAPGAAMDHNGRTEHDAVEREIA
jgi:ribonuclease HII